MPLPFFALALAIAAPQAARTPHKTPPPCHTLTRDQFSEPLTLSEPCYIVDQYASVSAPITISPGTTVSFGENSAFSLGDGGSINAIGTAEKPIILRGKEHSPGYWTGLRIASNSPRNHLSYVTVEDAGPKGGSDDGAVQVGVGARLSIDHTTIRNAAGNGLTVLQRGTLSHFEANNFEGNNTPISIKAGDAAILDPATTFPHNQHNYVLIHFADTEVEEDVTWHALAVPYHFDGTPSIRAHLTIEPGTRLEFREGFGININQNGSLTAEGTAAKPITFTGADEAPGFWDGVYFQSKSAKNILRNTVVTYAGTKGGLANAGVTLSPGAAATVQSSEIGFSASAAIRVMQNAEINADAATANRLHDNAQGIVQER